MPHYAGVRITSLGAVVASIAVSTAVSGLLGCGKDQLAGPQAEVKASDVKLDLPAVPAFDLPAPPADGSHAVKELRVKGKKLFDTDVTVHGFVTWAYDCKTMIRKPDEQDKDVEKRIEDDPTLCRRPVFYIGDDKATPADRSLWIVDVPRPYNKQELKNVQKKDRHEYVDNKCEPTTPKDKSICPPYAVGDEVIVTGTFKTTSGHGDSNSEGLLVFKKIKNVTQPYESPTPPPDAMAPGGSGAPPPPSSAPGRPSPQDLVNGKKAHG
jgi:hypothetical protein